MHTLNVGKFREVGDHYESTFYGVGRIVADMRDDVTLYNVFGSVPVSANPR